MNGQAMAPRAWVNLAVVGMNLVVWLDAIARVGA
jgi:hypothetical protein